MSDQPPGYDRSGQRPDMGPVTTRFARVDPGPSQTFGAVAAAVTLVGAVLVLVSFTLTNWLTGHNTHFNDLRATLDTNAGSFSEPARSFFGWLGWVLLIVTTLAALLAAVPTLGTPFRFVSPIVAIGAIVITFLAIQLVRGNPALSYSDYLKHARAGFYLAVAGFLLTGIGGAIGPAHQRR